MGPGDIKFPMMSTVILWPAIANAFLFLGHLVLFGGPFLLLSRATTDRHSRVSGVAYRLPLVSPI
jgi:hypothetical protein